MNHPATAQPAAEFDRRVRRRMTACGMTYHEAVADVARVAPRLAAAAALRHLSHPVDTTFTTR